MIKRIIFVWVSCLLFWGFTAQNSIQQIPLLDLKGQTFYLNNLHKNKATVVVFMSPECPLCQSYTLTINQLMQKYASKSIQFIGVVPTNDFSVKDIVDYKRQYKSNLNLVRDTKNQLVKKMQATITPEVFLINDKGSVLYSGRIDNWAYELGRKRTVITEHNLKDALESIVNNKPIKVKKTKAVGCFIE